MKLNYIFKACYQSSAKQYLILIELGYIVNLFLFKFVCYKLSSSLYLLSEFTARFSAFLIIYELFCYKYLFIYLAAINSFCTESLRIVYENWTWIYNIIETTAFPIICILWKSNASLFYMSSFTWDIHKLED